MAMVTKNLANELEQLAKQVPTTRAEPTSSQTSPPTPHYKYQILLEIHKRLRARLPKWERIEVSSDDDKKQIIMRVTVKEGFEHRRYKKRPIVWTMKFPMKIELMFGGRVNLTWDIVTTYPLIESRYKEVVDDILLKEKLDYFVTQYFMEYINPIFIFNPTTLSSRVGGPTLAYTLIAHLVKEGSPFHASLLAGYAKSIMRKWASEYNETARRIFEMGFRHYGFPALGDFLSQLDPINIPDNVRQVMVNRFQYAIDETIGEYAEVYSSPDNMPEDAVELTYKVLDKVAKTTPYEFLLEPVEFNQIPTLRVIESLMTVYPNFKPYALTVIRKYSMQKPAAPAVEEKKTEVEQAVSKIAQEIVAELSTRKEEAVSDQQMIEEIKKKILERLGTF